MLYAEARPLIASGDLLAFRNDRLVSGLIRRWTGGSWSHVGIAWRYRDRVFVIAAKEGGYGLCLLALSEQLPATWMRAKVDWTDAVDDLATRHLGKPYSYSDCALVALGREPHHDDTVCSVFAATVLKACGISLPLPSYNPSALVDALLTYGCEMREIEPDPK